MATVLLNGVEADGSSEEIIVSGFSRLRMQVWSAAGSDADVYIEGKSDITIPDPPWFTMATVVDPSTTGSYEVLASVGRIRVTVANYASGTIYAVFQGWADRGVLAT